VFDVVGELRKLRFEISRQFRPAKDITCETKNGLLTFSDDDRSIARRLYARRQWSWNMLQQCKELLIGKGALNHTKNDVLINVGANIGCILIPLMRDGMFRNGIAFEPAPDNSKYLEVNVQQNGLSDFVQTFRMGLSDSQGRAELEISPRNTGDHRVRVASADLKRKARFNEQNREVVSVQLARLDDVLDEHRVDLGERSLIWVDIQGHEGHFFLGARKTLAKGIPVVSELWPYGINRSGMSGAEFCGIVTDMFSTFYLRGRRRWESHPVNQFRDFYDRYDCGTSATDIVFISRN
jgi:FkbM family methyltransferase